MRPTLFASLLALGLATAGLASCAAPQEAGQPASTSTQQGEWRLSGRAMIAAADERAVRAGLAVIKAGGSAVDAAIAAHSVLGLVEPQSSGLGGGGYMVVYDRKSNTTTVFDGREAAPSGATADYFTVNGQNLGFVDAILSGKSVGVPGAVAMYKAAHDKYGKRPWASNFDAAIKLADEGFIVSPRLAGSLGARFQSGPLGTNPASAAYFFPNGKALAVGDRRTNPEYAATLRAVATQGPSAFYSGKIAENIVAAVHSGTIQGALSLQDLSSYRAIERPAICGPYLEYRICSAPPASSGGVAMNQIMGLYERISNQTDDHDDDTLLRDFVLAQQLGYADRDHYVADADAVTVPVADLLNPDYIRARATGGFGPGDVPLAGRSGSRAARQAHRRYVGARQPMLHRPAPRTFPSSTSRATPSR